MNYKEIYRNWQIEKVDYGYYEAYDLDDCDASMEWAKTIYELKIQIDERINRIS